MPLQVGVAKKENRMKMIRIIATGMILQLACITSAKVSVVNLPEQENIVDLSKNAMMQRHLVEGLLESGIPIKFITPAEAKEYFASYLKQKYGEQKADELMKKYFTDKYLGLSKEKEEEKLTPSELVEKDRSLISHIDSMMYSGRPERDFPTMEEASQRWRIQTRFLTPEQVYTGFVNSEQTGLRAKNLKQSGLDTLEKYKEAYPEKAEAIFSPKYFGVPANPEERKKYFLENTLTILNPALVKSIYEAAKRIMQVTQPGDYIVIFGNTPYFVGTALQKIAGNSRKIIIFPFSGSPNRQRPRNLLAPQDLVTKERLAHLKQRLEKVGLGPNNKDLSQHAVYFVDVLATGAGPAYVLEELLRMFKEAGKPIPNFNIIALNNIVIDNPEDQRNAMIAQQNAADGQRLTFYFPSINDTHFTIDGQVVYLQGHGRLDNLPYKELRMLPEYNAAYWLPQYDYLLHKPLTKIQKILLEYVNTNLDELIKKDKSKQ